ncbi:MAG: hypothetical protein ACYSWP_23935 [Planctomycetota bacterium]
MTTIIWILSAWLIWHIVGAFFLALIDKDERIFQWLGRCPIPGGDILIMLAWPVIIWYWWKYKKAMKGE